MKASKKAYTGGLGLYMSYDAYLDMSGEENFGLTCYEVCIPNPVKGFALNLISSKFPIGKGEIIENSGRFSFSNLLRTALRIPSRSMHGTAYYPYWENAARMTEDWAGLCCLLGTLLLIFPGVMISIWLVRGFRRGKEKVEDEYWPEWKEHTEEAVRVRQRRRWERRHDAYEK